MFKVELFTYVGTVTLGTYPTEGHAVRAALDYISRNGLCHYVITSK